MHARVGFYMPGWYWWTGVVCLECLWPVVANWVRRLEHVHLSTRGLWSFGTSILWHCLFVWLMVSTDPTELIILSICIYWRVGFQWVGCQVKISLANNHWRMLRIALTATGIQHIQRSCGAWFVWQPLLHILWELVCGEQWGILLRLVEVESVYSSWTHLSCPNQ